MPPKGKLVFVGTGIRSLGQLTLEAIQHIEKADKVYYAVRDAATEGFIKEKNKTTVDLYKYFMNDEGIPEVDLYIQIAELMLSDVRKGHYVVGAFYGHPGLFMSPARRAMAIAQAEGYMTRMLPGVSVDDCLLADLGIDPSFVGCLTCEARDFLIHDHVGFTAHHVIMYEVGQLNFYGVDNSTDYFEFLVKKMELTYGGSHPLVNYTGAISPIMQPVLDRLTVCDLYTPGVRERITPSSTFYFPPKESKVLNSFANELVALGKTTNEQLENAVFPQHPLYQLEGMNPIPSAYTEYAKKAIAALASRTISTRYSAYNASPAMQKAIEQISLSLDILETYLCSPASFAEGISGLKDVERAALASGDFCQIDIAMKGGSLNAAIRQ